MHWPQPTVEQKSTGMRDFLVTIGIAAVLLGAGYFLWQRMEKDGEPATPAVGKQAAEAKEHPLARQIEVTGFRIREPKPGTGEVRMVVVNHSAAEIADLKLQVSLAAKEGKQVASFPVNVKRLGPFGSTELSAPIKITMRAYELPDWQFLEARLLVQAPE